MLKIKKVGNNQKHLIGAPEIVVVVYFALKVMTSINQYTTGGGVIVSSFGISGD